MKLLIPDTYGIYIPNHFWAHFDFKEWNLKKTDYLELSDPNDDNYWEAWADLLDNAHHTDQNGKKWLLYQDGDLFTISEEELENDNNNY